MGAEEGEGDGSGVGGGWGDEMGEGEGGWDVLGAGAANVSPRSLLDIVLILRVRVGWMWLTLIK